MPEFADLVEQGGGPQVRILAQSGRAVVDEPGERVLPGGGTLADLPGSPLR
ncbi:hypothetical protein [Mycobacterium sp.]|uniref:hypothetical protein n=1 Tax=Mycobacterium sp. TaxID=1785 RepID=UPI003BAD3C70